MKGTKKAKILFLATGLVVLLGGAGAYFLYDGNSAKSSEISRLKAEAKDIETLESDLATLRKELVSSGDQLAHLEKGIPEVAYIPTMLKELEEFGKANGIEVKGVRPVPTPKDKSVKEKRKSKPYNELQIEIKGKGKYRAVLNFIAALKTFPKIVAARTISLQPKNGAKDTDSGTLEVTMELRAFLFKPDKEEEASNEPETDISLSVTEGTNEPVRPADAPNQQAPAQGQPNSTQQQPTGNVGPKSTALLKGARNEG